MILKRKLPKVTDFPKGSVFYIKEFDVPLVHEPSNKWFNWFGGQPKEYDVSNLKPENNWQAGTFEEWVQIIKDSIQ